MSVLPLLVLAALELALAGAAAVDMEAALPTGVVPLGNAIAVAVKVI